MNLELMAPQHSPVTFADKLNAVKIIRRADIPTISELIIDGENKQLGAHQDFRRLADLANFIPENSRLSMAFVSLKPGQELETHVHPISSMIIILNGHGIVQGDLNGPIQKNDIVLVPPGCRHGFIGTGPGGFEGLSIQFENHGLYENHSQILAKFESKNPSYAAHQALPEMTFDMLKTSNFELNEAFSKSSIFNLMREGFFTTQKRRDRFMGYLAIWSRQFQKTLYLRSGLCEDQRVEAQFRQHLQEEFNHDLEISRGLELAALVNDFEVLEHASWFSSKIKTATTAESIVIVHQCAETAAATFYSIAPQFIDPAAENSHFKQHTLLDDAHKSVGLEILSNESVDSLNNLMKVQSESWFALQSMFDRIAHLLKIEFQN